MVQRRCGVSADNARRLQSAAQWVESLPPLSPILILSSNRAAADDFARNFCRDRVGLWGVHRLTPGQLASTLATPILARHELAPLSRLGVEALAARSAHDCSNESPLGHFDPVSRMPGFAPALARTLVELRLEGASSENLMEGGAPGRDLARLLERYQVELERCGLADFARILEAAVTIAEKGRHRFDLPTLVLDLSPGSELEGRFMKALLSRAPDVYATVLAGDEEGAEAARLSGMTLEDLDEDLDGAKPRDRLQACRTWIFSSREFPERQLDESVEFFSTPGEGRECLEIARRIGRAAREGGRFDRVAVFLRDPKRYLPLLEDAFRRARIPVHFSRGTRRPDPAGRAFLSLLACAAEGLSASRFAEYLSLGQVPALTDQGGPPETPVPWVAPHDAQLTFLTPDDALLDGASSDSEDGGETDESPVIEGGLQAPFHWERLISDAAVLGGVDRWRRRLAGLRSELEAKVRSTSHEDSARTSYWITELERLRHLENFALPLVGQLSDWSGDAHWGEWQSRLERLAAASLRKPEPVLAVLAELAPMAEVGPVSLLEVRQVLESQLTWLRVEPEGDRYGKVLVAELAEVGASSFDWVFVPGLAEGAFPRKAYEDPLLLDSYRLPVTDRLIRQDKRIARERLLLRAALGSARLKLVASYSRMDALQGRPRVPSFYALEILRASEGRLPDLHHLEKQAARAADSRLSWPAPRRPRDALDEAEYDLALLEPLLRRPDLEQNQGRGRYLVQVNQHLARSMRTRFFRWFYKWSYADGVFQPDDATRALLADHNLDARSYSPTALETFSACPYRFLLSAIHRLRPRKEAVALERLDPLTRGRLFHEVQFQVFQEWIDRQRESDRGSVPTMETVDEVLDRVAAEYAEELAPAIPKVWASEVEEMRTDLRGWIRALVESEPDWKPLHGELGFGISPREGQDRGSRAEPVTLFGDFLLRGVIDLVEENVQDERLRVVDHKTGRPPLAAPRTVGGGEHLQPVLYGLAAESLLARPVDSGSLFYSTQRGAYRRLEFPLTPRARSTARTVLSTVKSYLGNGFLPAAPRRGACEHCDYRVVCGPYEEQRVDRKIRESLKPLEEVRRLP